ncbi:MAG: DUF1684 domain-containing protein, partial [Acidobacteria bacterium ACB2]|nr:DUF1684 domain-containing protein [Acidobacteria bacterium ACB2]
FLTLALLAMSAAAGLAQEPKAAEPTAEAYRAEVAAFRAKREAGLRSTSGWLTVVGLSWLSEGENAVGSSRQSAVSLPEGKAPATLGAIRLEKGAATFAAAPGVEVTSDGKPVSSAVLVPDTAGKPTTLQHGPLSFFLIERGGRLGVRVKDREAEALKAFRGVETFPVDPAWRVVARFVPHEAPTKLAVPNVLGTTEQEDSPGYVLFEAAGRSFRLDALPEGDGLFLVFGDETNGKETYGGGRFLYTGKPAADGTVVVDFNRATNPPCVFTPFATCPLPPAGNRLAVRLTAGEKTYGEH